VGRLKGGLEAGDERRQVGYLPDRLLGLDCLSAEAMTVGEGGSTPPSGMGVAPLCLLIVVKV